MFIEKKDINNPCISAALFTLIYAEKIESSYIFRFDLRYDEVENVGIVVLYSEYYFDELPTIFNLESICNRKINEEQLLFINNQN